MGTTLAPVQTDLHIAECFYHLGNYDAAVKYYRRVYRGTRADNATLNRAFQRIYDIALDYLSGKAGTYFVFGFLSARDADRGIDLLVGDEGLITEYPYLPFADDALMEIGKYYYDLGDYGEARRTYRRVLDDYRHREWRETAQFQLAMSAFHQIRGVAYDQKPILDAEAGFRNYLEDNPRGEQAEEAREKLRELAELQGESYLQKAKFYLRESQLSAARLYLGIVLNKYTKTRAADSAREIVRQIDRMESES